MSENHIHDEAAELIYQLNEEIEGGFVTEDEELYVVRSLYPTSVNGKEICPVVDFFFNNPPLKEELTVMKVLEVKQLIFKLLDDLSEDEEAAEIKYVLNEHAACLKDYTANNNKRNEKDCYVINYKDSTFPMMIYFEEDDISKNLEKITVKSLLEELTAIKQ